MAYLGEALDVRTDPSRVLEGARAFIVVADVYAARGTVDATVAGEGRIAKYARGGNYHEVMKRRLHRLADGLREAYPGTDFRTCVDTAPVPERELGALAGLGWIGKNTMLIHPRAGSWFVLGVVATNLELRAGSARETDHCGTCTRCIEACPTAAITAYSVDASRCVSYLTIERREAIPEPLRAGVGDWVFGCDVCQDVCPHNSGPPRGYDAHGAYAPVRERFDLLAVLGWDEAARREAFAGSAMKRVTLAMMKRNALIAAGNVLGRDGGIDGRDGPRTLALRDRLVEIAADAGEAPLVRDTAREVLASLRP